MEPFSRRDEALYSASVQKMSQGYRCDSAIPHFQLVPEAHFLVIAAPRPSVCHLDRSRRDSPRGAFFCPLDRPRGELGTLAWINGFRTLSDAGFTLCLP